jgi:hypothetical protein
VSQKVNAKLSKERKLWELPGSLFSTDEKLDVNLLSVDRRVSSSTKQTNAGLIF